MPSRRGFIKTLLPLAGLGLTACNRSETPHIIRMGVNARPRMLDPRKATDALSSRVNRLLYRQLVDFNERFEAVADLADWQQITPQHYRFTLRESSQFHNGEPLTAADVVATYQSVLNPDFGSPHQGSLKNIKQVVQADEKQVDFWLYAPDPLFVGRLVIGILPKSLIEANHPFHERPVGSGACRFISLNEQKLVLERQDKVTLEFINVKDPTVRVLKLKKGEIDLLQNDLSPELIHYCEQQSGLQVQWQHGTGFGYLGFNFDDALLSQLAVREAIAYGIDRQAIVNALFNGHARLAGGLLVPEHWAGVADIHGFAYDPERAKLKLAEAQIPPASRNAEGLIELSFKTSNDPTRIRLATIYQSQLRRIGIHLNIQSYDWGTFYSDIKQGRFQLYSLAWVGIKSPDIFQYVFASEAIPPNGANRGRYRDSVADRLIALGARQQTLTEQAETYRQLQRHLQQTLAAMPLWYEDQYAVSRDNVHGMQLFADGRLDGLLKVTKT